ncbi:hypothetical protein [Vibrio sp. Isolate24]|uniref:hypothetical protein n=1 Tax=Vibrio sp. Isolate24 TaxID=2908534 RepID=UPI001EFC3854|nr:hypothetical protein [Vibrio sp. Isolate24]MCG9676997.1 hypothetical protein [Vibrio sp. Isolate24]
MKSTRVTPGIGKGFLPPLKRKPLTQSATTSQPSTANISPENMYWPPYHFTTGEYINTKEFPDHALRKNLENNHIEVMYLTLEEAFKVLQGWGWKDTKDTWKSMTTSTGAQVMINYGVNGKDVVSTSMVIAQFNIHGLKATKLGLKATFGMKMSTYYNKIGTEMIKLSGYSGLRRILTASAYRLDNPKVVQLGIGKYGLANSIKSGTVLTIYIAAGYRILDYALNDEVFLADLIGSLATDIVKIGISSAVSALLGSLALGSVAFVAGQLAVVVLAGLATAMVLNMIDEHYGITPKVIELLEKAQQETVQKGKELQQDMYDSFLDLAAMLVEGLLEKGKKVVEEEVKIYLQKSLNELLQKSL